MYKGDIPYSASGKPLNYPDEEYEWEYGGIRYKSRIEIEWKFGITSARKANRVTISPIWKPNAVFEASLCVEDYARGRSAANFIMKDSKTGVKYTMFLTDFLYLLQNHTLEKGTTPSLKWEFTKRGQNYGVKLAC